MYNNDKLNAYTRLPSRLEQLYPDLAALQKEDMFGSLERLRAIKAVLGGRQLGEAIELGGDSGYFCLSLIDAGMMTKATVYDLSLNALSAGRIMARQMGIDDKIAFVERAIDLDFVRNLPSVDTMLCLNLLHHAGNKFDVIQVDRDGWGRYAEAWLHAMGRKCRQAIVSIGLDPNEPRNWDAPHQTRPVCFAQLAERVGWSVVYDANVADIQALGVERANSRHTNVALPPPIEVTRSTLARKARKIGKATKLRLLWNVLKRRVGATNKRNKRKEYHLYIFERVTDTSFSGIRHLLVVAGPSGAGKSTFLKQFATGQLPEEIVACLPPTEKWLQFEARDYGLWFPALRESSRRLEIPDVMLHYKLKKMDYHNDPALNVLNMAETITVVTLRPPIERLISQLTYRDYRSRSRRKLRCYRESGWLDNLYKGWQAYLQSLAAEGGDIKQIFLEPDPTAQVGAIFRWRMGSAPENLDADSQARLNTAIAIP